MKKLIICLFLVFCLSLCGPAMAADIETVDLATLQKKAEAGNADSQYTLGMMYANGQGVSKNYVKALELFRKAAEQGHAGGQEMMGLAYVLGDGVPESFVHAYAWYSLASAQDQDLYGEVLSAIESDLSPGQIAEGQKLAAELWEKIKKNKAH